MKVSNIYLQFPLSELYEMMKKRGHALSRDEVYDQIKWEMKMKKFIHKHKEEIVIPKEAYITFENEEAYENAVDLMQAPVEERQLESSTLKLNFATEPSNIEYDHLYDHSKWRFFKIFFFYLAMFMLILFSGAVLFFIQKLSSQYERIYPKADCESVLTEVHHDYKILKEIALNEWYFI